jgi:hypothetical protein
MNEVALQTSKREESQSQSIGSGLFASPELFGRAFEIAEKLAKSTLLPKEYRDKPENVFVALEIANRRNISPLAVMQNLNVINGRPSWSSAYIMTAVNISGIYTSPLRFTLKDEGEKTVDYEYWDGTGQKRTGKVNVRNLTCQAAAIERATGATVNGPLVSIEMAVKEGWYTKSGSKWKTMPEVMLQYRAATFFVRANCPEVIEGMHTVDEVEDANIIDTPSVTIVPPPAVTLSAPAETGDKPRAIEQEAPEEADNQARAAAPPALAKPRKEKKSVKSAVAQTAPDAEDQARAATPPAFPVAQPADDGFDFG